MTPQSEKSLTMLDITGPQEVEIKISYDGRTVWINVDGICRLRCCRIEEIDLTDARQGPVHR